MTSPIATSCQVVPGIPSFSVDDGFRYRIPPGLGVSVGHRVRVRVGGRRVRGFVTAVFDDEAPSDRPLIDVDGIVGSLPSFDAMDLTTLRWCASYYVAPLSVILARTAPPNAARSRRDVAVRRTGTGSGVRAIQSAAPHTDAILSALDTSPAGSTLVVAPSVAEVEAIGATLRSSGHRAVVAHSDLPAKDVTAAWVTAATGTDVVLVGTREVALWPVPDLGSIVVVEDERRVMRSPSTPTIGVREVALERASARSVPVSFIAPLVSLPVLRRAPRVTRSAGRDWPLVEVADRGEEPPTGSALLDRTRRAIANAARAGGTVFVLVPRRGYAAAFRCAKCGTLRRCLGCGAAVAGTERCLRCGAEAGACPECGAASWRPLGAGIGVVVDDLARTIGPDVGGPDDGARVTVGTERDLIGRRDHTLVAAIDVDGMALAPNYRAAEDALRTLVRLAQTVGRGRGRRMLVQTSDPDQPVVRTLVAGHPETFLAEELTTRRRSGFPPFGSLLALEVSRIDDESVAALARDLPEDLPGATVLGPAESGDRVRWLVAGADLLDAKLRLRGIVGTLRDRGLQVRVDVDPIDL